MGKADGKARKISPKNGGYAGFTLIELLVVMAIIATLLSIVAPRYFNSLDRSKETVLRQDLGVMRDAIDKFYSDTGNYPGELAELVEKRYLRAVPVDPLTESAATWVAVPPPAEPRAFTMYIVVHLSRQKMEHLMRHGEGSAARHGCGKRIHLYLDALRGRADWYRSGWRRTAMANRDTAGKRSRASVYRGTIQAGDWFLLREFTGDAQALSGFAGETACRRPFPDSQAAFAQNLS